MLCQKISMKGTGDVLNLTPEALFRDHSRFSVMEVNTDNPQFMFARKDDPGVLDLPPGSVDITKIAYNRDLGVMCISTSGNLPTAVAKKLFEATNWNALLVDKTGHASYEFLPTEDRIPQTHTIMERNCSEMIPVGNVEGQYIRKFEFACHRGSIVFACHVGDRCYTAIQKPNELTRGFDWKPIRLPDDQKVTDVSMRIVDSKVGIIISTNAGLYLHRDNEVNPYRDTDGKDIVAVVAGYAGYNPRADIEKHDPSTRLAFITREKDNTVALWSTPVVPTGKITPIKLKDDVRVKINDNDDVRVLCSTNTWYLKVGATVIRTEIPFIG